jgi:hypothetical protein
MEVLPCKSLHLFFSSNFSDLNVHNTSHSFIVLMFLASGNHEDFIVVFWACCGKPSYPSVPIFSPASGACKWCWYLDWSRSTLVKVTSSHWESYLGIIQFHKSLILQFQEFGSGICLLCLAVYKFRFVIELWENIHRSAGRQELSQGNCWKAIDFLTTKTGCLYIHICNSVNKGVEGSNEWYVASYLPRRDCAIYWSLQKSSYMTLWMHAWEWLQSWANGRHELKSQHLLELTELNEGASIWSRTKKMNSEKKECQCYMNSQQISECLIIVMQLWYF